VSLRSRSTLFLIAMSVAVLASWATAAATFDTYRDFTLRDTAAAVMARTGTTSVERDLKTLHSRPNVIQELTWRPRSNRGSSDARDSVGTIVFSFLDDRLYRMAVSYDPSSTEGLTRKDLVDSLSAIYGPQVSPAPTARRSGYDNLDATTPLALWRSGDTTVTLNETSYSGNFGLVITSTSLEAAARKAQAAAVTQDAREAPAREAARVKAEADAARTETEKTRSTNKGTFKP
jgi:hypothetical protein